MILDCSRSGTVGIAWLLPPMHPGRDEADTEGIVARAEELPQRMEQDDTTIRRINGTSYPHDVRTSHVEALEDIPRRELLSTLSSPSTRTKSAFISRNPP